MLPLTILSLVVGTALISTRFRGACFAFLPKKFSLARRSRRSGSRAWIEVLFVACVFLIGVPPQAKSDTSKGGRAHTVCSNCHLGEVKAGESKIRACVDCHRQVLMPSGTSARGGHYAVSGHVVDAASGGKVAPLGGKVFERLDCLTCDVAHDHGEPKLLRLNEKNAELANGGTNLDPATQLCLSCHPLSGEFKAAARGYVRHPIGIPVPKLRAVLDRSQLPPLMDIRGTQDPADDVIGCMTCHEVHASRNSFILRWSFTELSAACLKCHSDIAPSGPGNLDPFMARR